MTTADSARTGPNGSSGPPDRRDPLGLAPDAPLFRAYLAALERRAAGLHSFTTPGHKGSTALTGEIVSGDMGMSGGVDTVKYRHGYLLEAERRAAELWGADLCRFSVGGSTHGNQMLALAAARPGDEVIVTRLLHRSLLLGLVLAGLRPVWVRPRADPDTGLPLGVEPPAIAAALEAHPGAKAVFLGDPSYVGTFSDVAAHAAVAHAHGVPLLVDAAWAAHFGFHPDLPPHAMEAGADAMVTSAHKVLPAYSQAAMVFARTERLDRGRLDRAFEATFTTSPSGRILASIDAARALLERSGPELIGRMLSAVAGARARLAEVPGLVVLEGDAVDPAKVVVVLSGTGANGLAIEDDLIEAGMPLEMADRDTVVAVVTIADSPSDVGRLADTLAARVEHRRGAPRPVAAAASWTVDPVTAVTPRDAFFAAAERVPMREATGRVSAELVAPYPPGVPVLAPGELVTEAAVDALLEAHAEGVRIAYAADPTLATLEVLADS